MADAGADDGPEQGAPIFREEALREMQRPLQEGGVLRLDGGWVDHSWRLLALSLVAALMGAVLGRVGEYARGPAAIRLERRVVVAREVATVAEVLVAPGDAVGQGDAILRLHDGGGSAELARAQQELDSALVAFLRDPADATLGERTAALRARRDLARDRLAERTHRAEWGGVVSDVRVRPGQRVAAGDDLVVVEGAGGDVAVVALLPGYYRPMLRPGDPLFLELSGYPREPLRLQVGRVADEVIGSDTARRYLGEDLFASPLPQGPVVLVEASLPGRTFMTRGSALGLYHGMPGVVEVRVRSEPLVFAAFPSLRGLLP